MVLYVVFLVPLALLGFSMYWLRNWSMAWPFFSVNIILIVAYMIYFWKGDLAFFKSNQYGFERLFLFLLVPLVHTFFIFVFAFFMKLVFRK
ncbi:hypothetical protein AAY42_06050 [Flagellimonas eckloniae]|uniref:Uncharacterized protein n=1 Tax=Flagellimonas eckloniae TaxID=346185 RepID=A0A0Q1CFI1_9FLAO|nr:hypothetical protein AAY42_06050 [Allomuricauda eckloniae]